MNSADDESDLWLCPACGAENSEQRDIYRCSCCFHAHPYFCDGE